jgi:uncharacterized protein YraI
VIHYTGMQSQRWQYGGWERQMSRPPCERTEARWSLKAFRARARDTLTASLILLSTVGCAANPGSPTTAATSTATSPSVAEVPGVVTGEANLRSGPGTDFETVGKLPAQSTVVVSCSNGEWMQLSEPTRGAYVHVSLLTMEFMPSPCPVTPSLPQGPETVVVPPETIRETITVTSSSSSRTTTPTTAPSDSTTS